MNILNSKIKKDLNATMPPINAPYHVSANFNLNPHSTIRKLANDINFFLFLITIIHVP